MFHDSFCISQSLFRHFIWAVYDICQRGEGFLFNCWLVKCWNFPTWWHLHACIIPLSRVPTKLVNSAVVGCTCDCSMSEVNLSPTGEDHIDSYLEKLYLVNMYAKHGKYLCYWCTHLFMFSSFCDRSVDEQVNGGTPYEKGVYVLPTLPNESKKGRDLTGFDICMQLQLLAFFLLALNRHC